MKGSVKWFNEKKGYGFILSESGNDVFVHITDFIDKSKIPDEGDNVEFEVAEGKKGNKAIKVRPI